MNGGAEFGLPMRELTSSICRHVAPHYYSAFRFAAAALPYFCTFARRRASRTSANHLGLAD
jgi:hypothetical protein